MHLNMFSVSYVTTNSMQKKGFYFLLYSGAPPGKRALVIYFIKRLLIWRFFFRFPHFSLIAEEGSS